MKADTELRRDVIAELRWEPCLPEGGIAVDVVDGVVRLSGYVDSYAQRLAAVRATERVKGVHAITNQLRVRLSSWYRRCDAEITHAIAHTLHWDSEIPDDRITATVENGWVTLTGRVDWQYQREAAEAAVRHLVGVTGVTNGIALSPVVTMNGVKAKIEAALERSATLDSQYIAVEAHGDAVVLRGTVRSWAERHTAERIAWSAPGVHSVRDELVIGE